MILKPHGNVVKVQYLLYTYVSYLCQMYRLGAGEETGSTGGGLASVTAVNYNRKHYKHMPMPMPISLHPSSAIFLWAS